MWYITTNDRNIGEIIMPNYLEYQKSVAAEFRALENRVRNLIDNKHWGEEGRFKEVILVNYLKKVLPKHLSVGTGFVRNKERITNQIDIIIYDNTFPLLFSEGDFIISTSENVVAIIEVKSNIMPSKLCEIIYKANENAEIIRDGTDIPLFNGVFAYNATSVKSKYIEKFNDFDFSYLLDKKTFSEPISRHLYSCVNHIALGSKLFVRLWPLGQDDEYNAKYLEGFPEPYYSFYKMEEGLAYSYFFANLQEHLIRLATGKLRTSLPDELKGFLFPIIDGKETGLLERVYLNNYTRNDEAEREFRRLEKFFRSRTSNHIDLSYNEAEAILGQELNTLQSKNWGYLYPSKSYPIMAAGIAAGFTLVNIDKRTKKLTFAKQ